MGIFFLSIQGRRSAFFFKTKQASGVMGNTFSFCQAGRGVGIGQVGLLLYRYTFLLYLECRSMTLIGYWNRAEEME